MPDVTQIVSAIYAGDAQAAAQLLPQVYGELRKLAAARLANEAACNMLDPTDLVHEAFLRLIGKDDGVQWDSRGHFFAAAATAMRRILIERARKDQRLIHGGGRKREELHPDLVAAPAPDDNLLALDEALAKLAKINPVTARLVELRYFVGLTGVEAANLLGISNKSADRYWAYARAWLRCEMEGSNGEPANPENR
jgi:RNA polymerase sigma factor (TIGR02999 family)